MKSYVKVYFKFFGYDESSWIECECGCGQKAVDIHHLESRSIASHLLNKIENLCAVTRLCHDRADKDRKFNSELKLKHLKKIKDSTYVQRF
jgi:hypothetical protein